jgi:hypothetical protein
MFLELAKKEKARGKLHLTSFSSLALICLLKHRFQGQKYKISFLLLQTWFLTSPG